MASFVVQACFLVPQLLGESISSNSVAPPPRTRRASPVGRTCAARETASFLAWRPQGLLRAGVVLELDSEASTLGPRVRAAPGS